MPASPYPVWTQGSSCQPGPGVRGLVGEHRCGSVGDKEGQHVLRPIPCLLPASMLS